MSYNNTTTTTRIATRKYNATTKLNRGIAGNK
jgi:hypothetical protein